MAKNKPTPEEQLLNLIEGGDELGSLRQKRKRTSFLAGFNLSGLGSFFQRFLGTVITRIKVGIKEPDIKVWNKILGGVVILLMVYLAVDFTVRRFEINQITKKIAAAKKWSFKEGPAPEVRPFLHYLEMVQRRDIFMPVMLKGNGPSDAEIQKMLAALTADLKLVGISWGEVPEAIVEDKKANKTYFLKTGDTINTLKVYAIYRDKVTFDANGEKLDLM